MSHDVLTTMGKMITKIFELLKAYPYSIGGFVLTLIPWILNSIAYINFKLNPPQQGHSDYRGEGLMFGVILALLLSTILLVVTILNLIFKKNSIFYTKLAVITVVINLVWYKLFVN